MQQPRSEAEQKLPAYALDILDQAITSRSIASHTRHGLINRTCYPSRSFFVVSRK